jgi:hypothetical protein
MATTIQSSLRAIPVPPERHFAESQQRPGEGERQGEDRMLELDHFERQPETFPEHAGE